MEPVPREELGPAEALLLETYGVRLLAFLCGTDEDAMRARLSGDSTFTDNAEAVLMGPLMALAQRVAGQLTERPTLPKHFALEVLGRPFGDSGRSLGVLLRTEARGQEDDLPSAGGDPIKDALHRLALDAFPMILAPTDPHWPTPYLTLFQHPGRSALQAAVQQDEALRQLFTEDDPGLGRRGYLYTSFGRGGSFQDVMFAEMILKSSWDSLTMTRPAPSFADLLEQVDAHVEALRSAARGDSVVVPGRIVFTGFITDQPRAIKTPWGVLRPLEQWERELAPPGLEGAVSGTDALGNQTTVSYAGEMVLETQVPYTILIGRASDFVSDVPAPWPAIRGIDASRRGLEGLQLALLLATERPVGSWVTARLAWQWTADLFGHGSSISWADTRQQPGFMPYRLGEDECQAIESWAALVAQHWTGKIDIGVRRLLSAANARTDMADRLVDAVIVWENLFGTSQGETRLRISSAMAWLLQAHDLEAREALQPQLRKIYDERSRIVHGGKPDESTLADLANAALTYARDILRILFRDRADVLALADGAARSNRLLLGG
jgi:hypothetical protein